MISSVLDGDKSDYKFYNEMHIVNMNEDCSMADESSPCPQLGGDSNQPMEMNSWE